MEGPGGYQFVGRTLQVWNTYRSTREFAPGRPWLLRFFDQIRFYPVSAEELLRMREDFPQGKLALRIEEETFRFGTYRRFLAEHDASIGAFKEKQRAAFRAERERWAALGQDVATPVFDEPEPMGTAAALPPGTTAVTSPIAGNLWKVLVAPGDQVAAGAPVAIVEAMKTEITIVATASGRVRELCATPGATVTPGVPLIVLDFEPPA
jgi:urea carboxylase